MSVPSSKLSSGSTNEEASIIPQSQKRFRKKSDRDKGRKQRGCISSEDEGVSDVQQKYRKNRPRFGEAQNDHYMSDDLYDASPVRKHDVIMKEHEDKKKNCKKDESDETGYISDEDEEDDRSVVVKIVDVPMEESHRPEEWRNDMRMEVDSD
ncbi:uncharacterized protein LOC106656990 [Trichogramma pretiosum]|uniref:uncharacterized protein LOC106656990 n=1 Tax=Trichogramma pretiosum TaxID=7493 RepID=UPI0006C9AF72|nr:uncharacterized protein LOC106656990 [Trichogramma pretiosum]